MCQLGAIWRVSYPDWLFKFTFFHQDLIYLPELINNLQANTVYWRECAEEQELIQQSQTLKSPSSICEKKDRNESIYEVNENEIDK